MVLKGSGTAGGTMCQEIHSPDERPEHLGRTLVTTNHDVIRQWAEAREASPAAVPGAGYGNEIGALRFDFPEYGGGELRHLSWQAWFETFDTRQLNFVYQEQRADGATCNFFRLEGPHREGR